MKKYLIVLISLVVASLILGLILEELFPSCTPGLIFQRMGAVIVVFGSMFSLVDVHRAVPISTYMSKEQIALVEKGMNEKNPFLLVNGKVDQFIEAEEYKKNIFKFEALVIIFGTIVWGFGDLAYAKLFNLGN